MKKTMITFAMITVLALTFGAAYAMEGGIELYNGITDFSDRSYDLVPDFGPAAASEMYGETVESASAGGLRSDESVDSISNGITNFSGKSYDTLSDLDR